MRDQKPRGVPMDEWLLAIGLANRGTNRFLGCVGGPAHRIAAEVSDEPLSMRGPEWVCGYGTTASAAYNGARGWVNDEGRPDAYAAGAALEVALESDW